MDSNISQELLINVFIPNTPLHDGDDYSKHQNCSSSKLFAIV